MDDKAPNIHQIIDAIVARLGVLQIISESRSVATIRILEQLADQLGVKSLNGVPIKRLYYDEIDRCAERMLLNVENKDAAFAAEVQRQIDAMKKGSDAE